MGKRVRGRLRVSVVHVVRHMWVVARTRAFWRVETIIDELNRTKLEDPSKPCFA